jgi:hypothetical protein
MLYALIAGGISMVYTLNKNNINTNTDLSQDQIDTFWSTFLSIEKEQEKLSIERDRDTVSGEELKTTAYRNR